jgi:hypothetical protein
MKGHDYISIAHKSSFTVGTRAALVCSFENYGAPLITLANSIGADEGGNPLYGDHYEIVAYEGGCNVWYITKAPDGAKRPFLNDCCLRVNFPIEAGSKIELGVATGNRPGFISVSLCGQNFDLPVPKLNDEFFIGFTACEGINRLYSAVIDTPQNTPLSP